MTDPISTTRLELIPLTLGQLELIQVDLPMFEEQTGLMIKRDFLTERVQRAIGLKVKKMREVDASKHEWFTYWLIIIKGETVGAGMLGFKGYPNKEGSTEIGYGIDPAYQHKGYMSEAVKALIDWAFSHPYCQTITATEVTNPASNHLLEKLGADCVRHTDKSRSWEIRKH
jgi:RimJ/RimL family protein N-acetyltransferase